MYGMLGLVPVSEGCWSLGFLLWLRLRFGLAVVDQLSVTSNLQVTIMYLAGRKVSLCGKAKKVTW